VVLPIWLRGYFRSQNCPQLAEADIKRIALDAGNHMSRRSAAQIGLHLVCRAGAVSAFAPARLISVHESFRPAYRSAMSTKHIATAADLVRFGASVKIDCGACEHLGH
jgi:hypothetical protein